MPKQKFELSPPVQPDLTLPPHASDYETFGRDVVMDHESLVQDTLSEDYAQQHIHYATQLEAKITPEQGRLAYGLGKIVGKSITGDEQQFLETYNQDADIWQSKAEGAKDAIEIRSADQVNNLAFLRRTINQLTEPQREIFESYCGTSLPPFLFNVAGSPYKSFNESNQPVLRTESEQPKGWQQWFGKVADDDQLLNFLQWHVDTVDRQQIDVETKADIEIHKLEYGAAILEGIKAGRQHPEAIAAVREIDNIKVVIGDVFDTLMRGEGGYHIQGTNRVVIPQGYGGKATASLDLRRNMQHAIKHEFNHAVLSGLGHPLWFEEAMTEHNARVFENGMPGELNPDLRPEVGAYPESQRLIDTLANYGDPSSPVAADLFTRFYSARSPAAKLAAYRELDRGLEKAWGTRDVLVLVGKNIYHHQIDLKAQRERDMLMDDDIKSDIDILEAAVNIVRSDLLQQPEVILGSKKEFALAS